MFFPNPQTTAAVGEPAGQRDTQPVGELAVRLGAQGSTLLAVWAHPDDESVLTAGLMASFAQLGGRVVNATATLGEHGTPDPVADPPARLARRRLCELRSALTHLGAAPPVVLGEEDGTCAGIPLSDGIEWVGNVIDSVRPDVVLSFGTDGVTGHPDHCAIARWTEAAVSERGDDIALLATAAGTAWPLDVIDGLHRIDAFWPGAPERADDAATTHVEVRGSSLARKLAALAAHRSQIGPLRSALGTTGLRRMAAREAYRPVNEAAAARLTRTAAAAAA
jgi:LmbE family N-acetylglucosaminyl deacetylase